MDMGKSTMHKKFKSRKEDSSKKIGHKKYASNREFTATRDEPYVKNVQSSSGFFIKTVSDKNDAADNSTSKKSNSVKKPFDKKKWRMQKYSKKYKLQQWEEKRKKVILKEYYKEIKDEDPPKVNVQDIYDEDDPPSTSSRVRTDELENENNLNSEITNENLKLVENKSRKRRAPYLNAQQEYQRLKEEKVQRKQEFLKRKEDRDKALKEYKEKKIKKIQKLNKKTRKGQPIMKYRMQMLLEQIEKSVS